MSALDDLQKNLSSAGFGSKDDEDEDISVKTASFSKRSSNLDLLEQNLSSALSAKPAAAQAEASKPVTIKLEEQKGFFSRALTATKTVTKKGLDAWNTIVGLKDSAINAVAEPLSRTKFIREAAEGIDVVARGEARGSALDFLGEELLKGAKEPVLTILNTKTGKKAATEVAEKTSNLPLKGLARLSALGDETYDEAYAAFLSERNDPKNPTWQKFLYELQDTGVQTAVGALLALGTTIATRNPKAGYAVSGAFYTALSADEQLQQRGEVTSTAKLAIDVIGDELIGRLLTRTFKEPAKALWKSVAQGFGTEGSTEVAQSLLKYATDYGNAKTEEEKRAVLDDAKQYVVSGGMAMEFFVGGVAGGIITGAGQVAGTLLQPSSQPKEPKTTSGASGEEKPRGEAFTVPDEPVIDPNREPTKAGFDPSFNEDINIMRSQAAKVQLRGGQPDPELARILDAVNDYATAFSDRTVYVPSKVSDAPLLLVQTVTFPDGKVAVRYSANTSAEGFSSEFDYSQLFPSKEAATKDATDAIFAWAQTQVEGETDPTRKQELTELIDFLGNPRAPITLKDFLAEEDAEIATIEKSTKVGQKVRMNGKEYTVGSILEPTAEDGETKFELVDEKGVSLFVNAGALKNAADAERLGIPESQLTKMRNQQVKEMRDRGDRTAEEEGEKKPKTQKEKVKEVLKEKEAATIKEVSEETGILEPNIRRILGVGTKAGEFERVENGVYRLRIDGQDIAYIHAADAVETLPKLAADGFKADMVFLDIPYDTPAVKGGNRGVKYNLISVDQFRTIVKATSQIARDEKTPVFHMYSQAKSGLKAMAKYNDVLVEEGFKPVARGEYTKLQKDGVTQVRNMRGNVIEPEGIIMFTKSGEFDKATPNLNFKLVRPKGYQTEKPAEMLGAIIEMATDEGDVVLDPFAGSGVTGEQAVEKGRKAVLIEKNEEVVEKIIKPRIEKAAQKRSQAGEGTHTPLRTIASEKIVVPTARTIYKKDAINVFTAKYKGKKFVTNTFVMELRDDVETNEEKELGQEMLEKLFEGAKQNTVELPAPVEAYRIAERMYGLVFDVKGEQLILSSEFYNYFSKQYKNMRLLAGEPNRAVAVYDGKTFIGLIMPITSGVPRSKIVTIAEAAGAPVSGDTQVEFTSKKGNKQIRNFPSNKAAKEWVAGASKLGITDAKIVAPSGGKYASAGIWENGEELLSGDAQEKAKLPQKEDVVMGGLEYVNAVELPELVSLARDLMGNVPNVVKKTGKASGRFTAAGNGSIKLVAELFEKGGNQLEAARTLAHEIGHLIDYLPEGTLKRGNMLGRLFTLRDFMSSTFDSEASFSKEDRQKIRNRITKEVLEARGLKFGDMVSGTLDPKTRKAVAKEVKTKTKKAIDAAITGGGYIKDATLRKELLTLTRWWHPYDPAGVPLAYKNYRESSVELYAEALSVLLNAPKRLQEMAPTFYNQFFGALNNKPEVRDAYFDLQALLSGDRELLIAKRREGVQAMFATGDARALDLAKKEAAEKEARRTQYWANFKHFIIDKNYQIIDRVKQLKKEGKTLNPDENPAFFLEERNYLGGKIKALFESQFNEVYQNVVTIHDIPWEKFGEFLFYTRIAAGDRSDVANPRGITPKAAEELLLSMRNELGADNFEVLIANAEKFRNAIKKIAEEAYQSGLYNKELYDQMQANPAYVTFQVIDHLEDGMTSRVYKSLGTLKDIVNPADSSMLKVITTIRATERNNVTKNIVTFLKKNFPSDIEEAKYVFNGKKRVPVASKKKNQELVTFFEEGKMSGFYVDPYIAQSINNESVGRVLAELSGLRFMNSTLYRPLFISFNLGFQSFNFIRDFVRFYKNIPDMTLARAAKRYRQAGRIARVRAFGARKDNARDAETMKQLQQLEDERVFSVTFNDIISGETEFDAQVEKILAGTGIKDFQPKPTFERVPRFAKPTVKTLDRLGVLKIANGILDTIQKTGDFIETLPKAAGVYEFQSKSEDGKLSRDQKSYIRRKLGSPDFLAGGTFKPLTNEVFLFSNAIIQGIRADVEVATDPETRAGFWWKTAKIQVIPKLLMFAATLGLMGGALKDMFDDVSEYDKTNYIIIPLGKDENGKTIYFRMPVDETSRFLGGVFWKLLNIGRNEQSFGQELADLASYTGGQLPSVSPTIGTASAIFQYISGRNPYDTFRGRTVLSDDVFKAGGAQSVKAFSGWVFQQMGGGIFYKFYHEPLPPKEESTVERVFNLPLLGNIIGRFVRVSDFGKIEQLRGTQKAVEKEEAQRRIKERALVNKYVGLAQERGIKPNQTLALEKEMLEEYLGKPAPTSKEEKDRANRLRKKLRVSITRGDAEAEVVALIDADTNAQREAILTELKADMDADEYRELTRTLLKNDVVSSEVLGKVEFEARKNQ